MVNLFGGTGFIGSYFKSLYPCVLNNKNDYVPKTKDILYLISTTDNFNIYDDPLKDIETNLSVLVNVLKNCKEKDVTFNFASSWFVYGNVPLPANENSNCSPKGFYSITKRTAEQLLVDYCETFNIKYRILRFANVLGRNDFKTSPKKNALTYVIQQLKESKDIKLYKQGEFYRDYIHVSDLCAAVNLVMEKGCTESIYNIGNQNPVMFKDAVNYAANKIGSASNILYADNLPENKNQPYSFYMDCNKLFDLGYKPKYSIENIIDELII